METRDKSGRVIQQNWQKTIFWLLLFEMLDTGYSEDDKKWSKYY